MDIRDELLRENNLHVLRVTGDSLMEAHLMDGDQVIVVRCETVNEDELVVALTSDGRTALGRFHRDGSRIAIEPVNPAGEAEAFNAENLTIRGVVVGILRKYGGS